MDATELATKMLEWEKLKRQMDALDAEISAAVMALGKTYNVGNVRATFAKGRTYTSYDWTPVKEKADPGLIADYTKTITTTETDWNIVAELSGIEPIVNTRTGEPSVTVKLVA